MAELISPYISIILATVDRGDSIAGLLESLERQTFRSFELIVVDQNTDDRVARVLDRYTGLNRSRLSSERGLSKARNVGLKAARGQIIYFCDDDQWLEPQAFEKVHAFFQANPGYGVLSGICRDSEGQPSVIRWDPRPSEITRANFWFKITSISLFYRRDCLTKVGDFDERLGIGSSGPFKSAEDSDLLLRTLSVCGAWFDPSISIGHPRVIDAYDAKAVHRARGYGMGMGALIRKHQLPIGSNLDKLYRPMGGVLLSLLARDFGRVRYYWSSLMGRVLGYLSWR